MQSKTWTIAAGIFTLMIVWAAWLILTRPESVAEGQKIPVKTVSGWQVTTGDLQPMAAATGLVIPAKRSLLYFQSDGPIVERRVHPGEKVNQGDLLLRIDHTLQTHRLEQAEARLENERKVVEWERQLMDWTEAKTLLLKREVQRQEKLYSESLSSEAAQDKAESAWLTQRAEQAQLENRIHTAEERLRILEAERDQALHMLRQRSLTAPFTGVVNDVMVEIGEQAYPNKAVLELVTLEEPELKIAIPSHQLHHIQMDQSVIVTMDTRTVSGRVRALQSAPDAMTHTHIVYITLPSDAGLTIGTTAQAHLPAPPLTDVSLVPTSAVLNEQGQHYVYLIDDRSHLRRTPVDILAQADDRMAVDSIQPGLYIVRDGVDSLRDGEAVRIRETATSDTPF